MLITCTKCKETKLASEFFADKRKSNGKQSQCKSCDRKRIRELSKKKRIIILNKLGGTQCNICGFSDIRALQIDHIYGGGYKETKRFGGIRPFYYYLASLPINELREKYQVLCANCNCIKRIENKEHRVLMK